MSPRARDTSVPLWIYERQTRPWGLPNVRTRLKPWIRKLKSFKAFKPLRFGVLDFTKSPTIDVERQSIFFPFFKEKNSEFLAWKKVQKSPLSPAGRRIMFFKKAEKKKKNRKKNGKQRKKPFCGTTLWPHLPFAKKRKKAKKQIFVFWQKKGITLRNHSIGQLISKTQYSNKIIKTRTKDQWCRNIQITRGPVIVM